MKNYSIVIDENILQFLSHFILEKNKSNIISKICSLPVRDLSVINLLKDEKFKAICDEYAKYNYASKKQFALQESQNITMLYELMISKKISVYIPTNNMQIAYENFQNNNSLTQNKDIEYEAFKNKIKSYNIGELRFNNIFSVVLKTALSKEYEKREILLDCDVENKSNLISNAIICGADLLIYDPFLFQKINSINQINNEFYTSLPNHFKNNTNLISKSNLNSKIVTAKQAMDNYNQYLKRKELIEFYKYNYLREIFQNKQNSFQERAHQI